MFLPGQIVKSTQRAENNGLFLMVVFDPSPSPIQFNAVVLFDFGFETDIGNKSGEIANNWNTNQFTLSTWKEFFSYIDLIKDN